jgi:hypothetical protein
MSRGLAHRLLAVALKRSTAEPPPSEWEVEQACAPDVRGGARPA